MPLISLAQPFSISLPLELANVRIRNMNAWIPTICNLISIKENRLKAIETEDIKVSSQEARWMNVSFMNGLHILSIVGVCILLSSPVTLIPQHDSIQFPNYWYEILMTFSVTYSIHWTLLTIMDNKMVLKINELSSTKRRFFLFLCPTLAFTMIICGLYPYWTYYLGYNYPMPFANFISDCMVFIFVISLWFQFPKQMRADQESRKRLISFVLYILWKFITNYIYNPLLVALKKMPPNAQPIMAIVLPMVRSMDSKVLSKLLTRCNSEEELVVESYANIISNVNFNLFATIAISTNTTSLTTYCVLLVGVVNSLYQCIAIMKLHRKIEPDESKLRKREIEKEKKIRAIAISEVLDILVPLMYTVVFVVAYYGPNATILKGIKIDYWNNTQVDNIEKLLAAELMLFTFDFTALVAVVLLLWYFCKINLLKEICWVLKTYWIVIAVIAGTLNAKVNKTCCV